MIFGLQRGGKAHWHDSPCTPAAVQVCLRVETGCLLKSSAITVPVQIKGSPLLFWRDESWNHRLQQLFGSSQPCCSGPYPAWCLTLSRDRVSIASLSNLLQWLNILRVKNFFFKSNLNLAPSQKIFKARLDGALSSLVQWQVSLPLVRGLKLGDTQRSLPIQTIL